MIFASFEFLFLFLPVFFATYFVAPQRLRNLVVLLFSWAFYAWWRVDFLAILVGVTAFSFGIALLIQAAGHRTALGFRLLAVGVCGNLGALGYFKYADFGVSAFNDLLALAGTRPVPSVGVVLPVGLSFYVLQSVSYLVDVRRGTVRASRSFVQYAAYKAMFSQLIAGPIVRYGEVAGQMAHRRHSWEGFDAGCRKFMVGFAMKVVVADTLAPLVDVAFGLPRPTAAEAWMGAAAYTLQLYFDFAGYSLMAIGLALAMGLRFPANFDHPYLAGTIQEFWRRWHMTLSRFLRDYLYFPLGGDRGGPVRASANLLAVMTIGGAWHGASWNFVLWGAGHGVVLVAYRWLAGWRRAGAPDRSAVPAAGDGSMLRRAARFMAGNLLTMLVVVAGRVVFRARDLPGAGTMYAGMLGLHGTAMSDGLAWAATPDRVAMIWIAAACVYAPLVSAANVAHWRADLVILAEQQGRFPVRRLRHGVWTSIVIRSVSKTATAIGPLLGFVVGLLLLYSREAVPFLYFQF